MLKTKNPEVTYKYLHKAEIFFEGHFLQRKNNVLFYEIMQNIIVCIMIHDPEFFYFERMTFNPLKPIKVSYLHLDKFYTMKSDFSNINEENFVTHEIVSSNNYKILTSVSSNNTYFEMTEIIPNQNKANSVSGKDNVVNKIYSELYGKENEKETKTYFSKK